MVVDVVDMSRSEEVVNLGRKLGFDIIFKNELKLKIIQGKDDLFNRIAIEKGVDILLDPHISETKDHLHFRRGGLNHITCELASKKGTIIAFSLSSLKDPMLVGRVMQDVKLCKKYKTKIALISLSKNKFGLRSYKDLLSLCKILGMDGKQAQESFSSINELISKRFKR